MVLLVLDGLLEVFESIKGHALFFTGNEVKFEGLVSLAIGDLREKLASGAARLDADSLSNGEEGSGSESLHCSCSWYFFLLLNYIAKAALL